MASTSPVHNSGNGTVLNYFNDERVYYHHTRNYRMSSLRTFEGRRSKRVMLKRRTSLVVNLDRDEKRLPCLVLDSSKEGYRLRVSFRLRRGQSVEVIFDPEPFRSVRCRIVWVGKVGSKQDGEVGLEIV